MGCYVAENQVQAEQIKLNFTFVWAFHLKVCYQNHACILFWIHCYNKRQWKGSLLLLLFWRTLFHHLFLWIFGVHAWALLHCCMSKSCRYPQQLMGGSSTSLDHSWYQFLVRITDWAWIQSRRTCSVTLMKCKRARIPVRLLRPSFLEEFLAAICFFLAWINDKFMLSGNVNVSTFHDTGSGWCPCRSSEDAG